MILKLLAKLFPCDRYEAYTISSYSFPRWPQWLLDYLEMDRRSYGTYGPDYGTTFILDGETGIIVQKDHNDKN